MLSTVLLKDNLVESLKFKVVMTFVSEVSPWRIYTAEMFSENIYVYRYILTYICAHTHIKCYVHYNIVFNCKSLET